MLIKNLNIWAQYESILFLDWRVLSLGFIFAVQIYHWLALDRKIIHFRTNFLQLSELLILVFSCFLTEGPTVHVLHVEDVDIQRGVEDFEFL